LVVVNSGSSHSQGKDPLLIIFFPVLLAASEKMKGKMKYMFILTSLRE
jgi:hypothetical protein